MKTLVVFYSKTGHTKMVAEVLAKKLNADLDEIIDLKNRKGFLNSVISCFDAIKEKSTTISVSKNPKDYDLVIIGSPVWAGRFTPAFNTYLSQYLSETKKMVVFTTSGQDKPGTGRFPCYFSFTSADLSNQANFQDKLGDFLDIIGHYDHSTA